MRFTLPLGRRLLEISINLVARERPIIPARLPPPLNLKTYDTFRKYVQHEDKLVHQRIYWMLLVYGFLYTAYALALQKKFEIGQKIGEFTDAKPKLKPVPHYLMVAEYQTLFFILLIIVVGIFVSGMAFMSIRAAKKAALNVQKVFESQYRPTSVFYVRETVWTSDGLILPTIAGGGNRRNRILGISSGLWIPLVMFVVWLLTLWFEIRAGGIHTIRKLAEFMLFGN